ncbi:MAG: hypothetical protein GX564_06630, partial [Oligosphaeraceae bacterium]|nr:hypothetical protein [Oligosphaeraceae bacterium]
MKENPLIPMGAITGNPSNELLTRRLEAYRKAGITQFLIYPRSGCEVEYLGVDWFRVCKHICAEAVRLGYTSVWLYDEFNWPSGSCNKQVLRQDEDFCLKQLDLVSENGEYRLRSTTNINMPDLLHPQAVDCFISLTHERYAQELAPWLGNLIKGIFTDEPDIGWFNYDDQDVLMRIPYYKGIEEDYQHQSGGNSLLADMIFCHKNQMDSPPLVQKLCAERFRNTYSARIS